MTQYLAFQDVAPTVQLDTASPLVDLIRAIVPQWPFVRTSRVSEPPFFSIEAEGPDKYLCRDLIRQRDPRRLNGLNAVCDMVAAMPFALLADKPDFICLHAAAVEIAGRLVVVPDTRRGGKSTLTAELARRGFSVFTDDFLPVRFDAGGSLVGRAGGIAPRLRLPLPEALAPEFRRWADADPGPENAQYKYLTQPDLPASGTLAPLGAVVLLGRDDTSAATLTSAAPVEAMDRLLYQNFMREVHSADILRLLSFVMANLPVLDLRYSDAGEAADLLTARFADWPIEVPADPAQASGFGKAGLDIRRPGIDVDHHRLRRRAGAAMAEIGEACYLADPEGGGIHRLDPLSHAIWSYLQAPVTLAEVRDVLHEVFPAADPSVIEADVRAFLKRLAAAGLISEA